MTLQNGTLCTADADGVRVLTLNRPDRRNALDTALASAVLQALRSADGDESVGAVLLTGMGTVFCAGADLGEFKGERANPEAEAHRNDIFLDLQLVFEEIRVPVVCAAAGAAVGAGASLAIAADFTVMGESARLSWPELMHGIVPSLMIGHLQHRTGRKSTFELLALAKPLQAWRAVEWGLANRVVADDEVFESAMQFARTLASSPRAAMRDTKHLFVSLAGRPLPDALHAARAWARERQASADAGLS